MSLARRSVVLGVVVVVVACATALWLAATGGGEERATSAADVGAVQERVGRDRDRRVLERAGIFVALSSRAEQDGRPCVRLQLLNPTAPNRAWLRERYGEGLCVDERPAHSRFATARGCPSTLGSRVRVPDVRGLRAYEAAQRLRRAGLRTDCNLTSVYRRPGRYSEANAFFVQRVCQRTARRGAIVRLQVVGRLPGGFHIVGDLCPMP